MDVSSAERQLSALVSEKRKAEAVHPLFAESYFIGLGEYSDLFVFAETPEGYVHHGTYRLPMNVPPGTKAAFPVEALQDYCCVITADCLEDPIGYIWLLHEMVHCFQGRHFAERLKSKLLIYQRAAKRQDWMWEINHPFPYDNEEFGKLIQFAEESDFRGIVEGIVSLKETLERVDFEYMVWQIWLEGFARFIENRIREANGLPENTGGADSMKQDRTSFYYLGDAYWRRLIKEEPQMASRIDEVFPLLLKDRAA